MSRRRLALATLVVGVVLAALVPVGRWEAARRADEQIRGMRTVRAVIGRLDSPSLSGYRRLSLFDCLTYRRGRNPFALELCFDREGRLIEAIDRRSGDPRIWSLRDDPTRSTLHAERAEIERLLARMGARAR